MKIKCEYCDSMFDDTLEKCPSCGAPNANVRRSTPDQPITIEELKEWYASKGLPPEETTRFFIGKDYREPKAFGIYKDETSGNYVVYKNKADGSRAVRYEGTDEAYAVNELFTRLKQEILEQKSHNLKKETDPNKAIKEGFKSFIILGITTILCVVLPFTFGIVLCIFEDPAESGYYMFNEDPDLSGRLFYHYSTYYLAWAEYDKELNDWVKTEAIPKEKYETKLKAKKYLLSYDYKPEYGGSDFKNSQLYDDFNNGFRVDTGYYAYDNDIFYHLKEGQDDGWYKYDDGNDDWSEVVFYDVPSDLRHQSVAQDFWYTPAWDSETQITDFEDTEEYRDYKEEQERLEREASSSYDDDDDDDYSWSSSDSWDSGSSDWGSDW
ncbi:MAG: hypothetical protein K6G75_06445 [Lachnospiraceae bacterium]|nr:hypothetical protein [Lachnospiraceae bacterium]